MLFRSSSVCRPAIVPASWPCLIPAPPSLCPSLGSTAFHTSLTRTKFPLHDHAWSCPVSSNRPPTCPIFASGTEAYRPVRPETYQPLLIIIGPAFSCLLSLASCLLFLVTHLSLIVSFLLSCLVTIGLHTRPGRMSPPSSTYILLRCPSHRLFSVDASTQTYTHTLDNHMQYCSTNDSSAHTSMSVPKHISMPMCGRVVYTNHNLGRPAHTTTGRTRTSRQPWPQRPSHPWAHAGPHSCIRPPFSRPGPYPRALAAPMCRALVSSRIPAASASAPACMSEAHHPHVHECTNANDERTARYQL